MMAHDTAVAAARDVTAVDEGAFRLQQLLAAQRNAFATEGNVTAEVRLDRLRRMQEFVAREQRAIVDATCADFGSRSPHQARMAEVLAVLEGFAKARAQLHRWMRRERRRVAFPMNLLGARARVEFQPKGVVGNLSTWNFPVYTALMPAAGILAAGNRFMLKPSELAPATAELLATGLAAVFDPSECVVVTGGPDVGAEFAALPFDHLIFTGGTHIGRKVMQAAANNLTPVTLELGGKSPVILSRSCHFDRSIARIAVGKALNAGQVCLSPDYCFVPRERLDEAADKLATELTALFPTISDNRDYTAIINDRHFERLGAMLRNARELGARLRVVDPAREADSGEATARRKLPMTLVLDPDDDLLVMQEEIFGPILCLKPYDEIDDCIRYINARPRPLGLYYFGEDAAEERRVLDLTISGGVTVNDVMAHSGCDDLPFGGIGQSGMGAYHGRDGFLTFSHAKPVYRQTRFDLMRLAGMVPPYGKKCDDQLDRLCRVR